MSFQKLETGIYKIDGWSVQRRPQCFSYKKTTEAWPLQFALSSQFHKKWAAENAWDLWKWGQQKTGILCLLEKDTLKHKMSNQ